MELTSDNLFSFVLRKYKLIANKNKKGEFPKVQISIKKGRKKKDSENSEIINYFTCLIINNSNIYNFLYNSIDPFINECFNNLEYLSITNNYIINLDFLLDLPNLFFLDLFGNPLDDLTALNKKNIFGYLRLSVEQFNENRILNIYNLQCGILDLELQDKTISKLFHFNNHHICMANHEVNYIIEKIRYEEVKIKSINKRKNRKNATSTSFYSNTNSEISFSDGKIDKSKIHLINDLNKNKIDKSDFIEEKPMKKVEINNPFLLKINKFFNDYQIVINDHMNEDNLVEDRNKMKLFISLNEIFSSENIINNKKYLRHEKEKLILLFDIYKKISVFNTEKKSNKFYIGNIYSLNVNDIIDNIFVKEVKTNIINHSQIPRTSIIILISIVFYAIGTISDKMMGALINYILYKYYEFDENLKYPDFSEMGDIHYLTFYYSTYDYIYKRMIHNEKNISIEKYKDILNLLQMDKLILKSNYLYQKLKKNKTKDYNKEFCEYKKIKINNEIKDIKKLNITKEFLVLIEFLCDFIIYEKIEETIINNSYTGEYSYLIELKENIEELEFKINNNLISSSLSHLKFLKNKKERIFNKFYFEKDTIKQIKNKEFNYKEQNDFYKSQTINNINNQIRNNSIFNNSNSNFNNIIRDNEYNKDDDVDVDYFFLINGHTRNKNNKLNMKKINYNFPLYKRKEEESNYFNENSSEDINNISIKLPHLYQKKPQKSHEEFEVLKKIIFDPDLLSQHARDLIKFEKQKKRINKNSLNSNINTILNKKNEKIENKKDQSISIDRKGSTNSKHNERNINTNTIKNYFDKSKTNLQFNKPSQRNSNITKYKTIFNTTNLNLNKKKISVDIKSPKEEIELKTLKNNENDNNIKEIKEIKTTTNRNCIRLKKGYKSPFSEIPESFPGMTLLKFGANKKNLKLKKNKFRSKKSLDENEENKKLTYKEIVMNKIKQTVKDNIYRNARRYAFPISQNFS